MTNKPTITSVQLVLMAVGSAMMFPKTFMPILNTPPANQDVWIVLILSFFYIFVINLPMLILVNKCRGLNINDMAETILGKFFGKVACVLFTFMFLFCFIACAALATIFTGISILPESPPWAILLLSYIPAAYAAYKGAGVIGRLATFIVPFILLTIVIFLFMGLSQMDLKILQPVLADSTILELNEGAFFTAARFSEGLIFLVFSFFLTQKANFTKTYAAALTIFGISFLMIVVPTVTILGIDYAKNTFNPYFVYIRQLHIYDFIQRVQALNTLAWYPGLLLKFSIYCFMASYVLSGVFKAKSHKNFVIPLTFLAFIVCMIPAMQSSSFVMLLASDQVFPFILLPITCVLPLIIVVVYFIRRKKIDIIIAQKKMQAALSESEVFQTPENSGTDQAPNS